MTMEPQAYPDPYTILPKHPHIHRSTIIFLHGTSTTGPEFAGPLLSTSFTSHSLQAHTTIPTLFPSNKLIFPTGALRPTTVFNGRDSNAWFDVHSFADRTTGEDSPAFRRGLKASVRYLAGLVKAEVEILERQKEEDRGKVFLWGFSQGSAMAAILLLSGELERLGVISKFGGVIGMSGWLPLRAMIHEAVNVTLQVHNNIDPSPRETRKRSRSFLRNYLDLDDEGDGDNQGTEAAGDAEFLDVPILLAHGRADEKVRFEWGLQMKDGLAELGLNAEWKAYDNLGHWWNENEIADVTEFLGKEMGG